MHRAFHVEVVARDARPDELHRPLLLVVVGRRRERRGVVAERLARVQPGGLRAGGEGGSIVNVASQYGLVGAVADHLHDRQPRRLGAACRHDLPLVPAEAPEGGGDRVPAGVDRDELAEVRVERLVFVAEQPDARPAAEHAHAVVRALVEVGVFAGRREVGVRLLVLQQHAVAVGDDVGRDVRRRERDALLDRLRGARPGGDGRVEDAVRGFEVLREVDVGQVERVGVLVEPMNLPVRRQIDLQGNAGQVEQVADGVLVLAAGEAPEPRLAVGRDRLSLGRDQLIMDCFRSRGGVNGGRAGFVLRWHLPGRDAVVDLHPPGDVLCVGRVELERGEVEPALLGVSVVARVAVRLEELGGRCREHGRREDEEAHAKPQRRKEYKRNESKPCKL